MRPSLWTVVFYALQQLAEPYSWRQDDPASATVEEVIKEIADAIDAAIFRGCMMLGVPMIWTQAEIPDYMLVCDGAEYLNADYPDYAAIVADAYKTDADHFRVPSLYGRFPLGGVFPGTQGGEETHALTIAEMPTHDHDQEQFGTAPSVVLGELAGFEIAPASGATGERGDGEAHNNMPPFEQVTWVMLVAFPTGGV